MTLPFQAHSSIFDTFHADDVEIVYQEEALQQPSVQGPLKIEKNNSE